MEEEAEREPKRKSKRQGRLRSAAATIALVRRLGFSAPALRVDSGSLGRVPPSRELSCGHSESGTREALDETRGSEETEKEDRRQAMEKVDICLLHRRRLCEGNGASAARSRSSNRAAGLVLLRSSAGRTDQRLGDPHLEKPEEIDFHRARCLAFAAAGDRPLL